MLLGHSSLFDSGDSNKNPPQGYGCWALRGFVGLFVALVPQPLRGVVGPFVALLDHFTVLWGSFMALLGCFMPSHIINTL